MITYIINREDRQDRLHDIRIELENQQINAHLFPAVIDPIGWKGCRDSHIAILEKCKDKSLLTIYEDDVTFLFDREATIRILADAMEQLPKDFDCLYLGCSPQVPQERYSENLYRIRNAKCTHAILWHNRKGGAIEYILSHKEDVGKFDRYLYEIIQRRFLCFAVYPMLCSQRESKSNISKRTDVSSIERNFNKYCI